MELAYSQRFPAKEGFFSYNSHGLVTHLNGTALPIMPENNDWTSHIFRDGSFRNILFPVKDKLHREKLEQAIFVVLVNLYEQFTLQFHWDCSDQRLDKLKKHIRVMSKNATSMVVVGYSFPMYNRRLDNVIIDCMKGKKIYIQDPKAEKVAKRVAHEFEILEENILPISRKGGFYIPRLLMD